MEALLLRYRKIIKHQVRRIGAKTNGGTDCPLDSFGAALARSTRMYLFSRPCNLHFRMHANNEEECGEVEEAAAAGGEIVEKPSGIEPNIDIVANWQGELAMRLHSQNDQEFGARMLLSQSSDLKYCHY